ncbi:tRNA (adenosine(37)-N6)-dimethylallyltransferase MiaA [Candidatus Nomurabacteria bacterium RIFCSPHIGHO2_01_FULL_38_19]|uniref:tRNA dimethylallyltransferase n=1 Tax=Candidatus Nomurabacteria bacterium RIFCSPHIGHO2_01_FULL_38_19 TaxID=1801732 RepID=A0A1F6UUZ8_9BACT|nr:MAG: tRNA (adenosine(37)-N6)-dimethylallyltransferase MiaA [Candidatus Nomurabacteria bacterium RIFCSPHIGHO2_01_FULL_38_19]
MKPKIIVILGQTATGKSDLAVRIAKQIGGEIISADSRQIYKDLDIGTGKIIKREMKGISHHLLDVANPKKIFTVAEYQKLAISAIAEIAAKEKIPIICGGTGFYIDAITKGIVFPEVPSNLALRKKLALVSDRVLMLKLKKLDPNRARSINPKNKVRLIRAIEIAKELGKVPKITEKSPPYKFIKIGLYLPEDKLKKKVKKRVKKIFQGGLLGEIKKLKQNGVSDKRLRELGFEYFNPTPEKVLKETLKYAKRQMTWFKRDKTIKWFEPRQDKEIKKYIGSKL